MAGYISAMMESRSQIIITHSGWAMKVEFEDDKLITYLMLVMMALGFIIMLLV
jgi:hypothetical protein